MMQIYALDFGTGQLAVSPIPGRVNEYVDDLQVILEWQPDLVLTMTTQGELDDVDAARFGDDLQDAGLDWQHLPIGDFGTPPAAVENAWADVSAKAQTILAKGGKVLAHCYGGQGRSGMAVLRIMVDAGENPKDALQRLRSVRSKAVETDAQMVWATKGVISTKG